MNKILSKIKYNYIDNTKYHNNNNEYTFGVSVIHNISILTSLR